MLTKISLEGREYNRFRQLFATHHFGSCRYGQAFFNHFNLHKMKDNHFGGLYEVKDRAAAEKLIDKYFELT